MKLYATVPAGSVEYSKTAAAVGIDDFIRAMERARDDGATHVLGLSGNYRGAQYVRLAIDDVDFEDADSDDDEEDEDR